MRANVLKAQAIENDHGILKVKIKGGTAKVFVRGKDVNPGDMVNIAVRSDSIQIIYSPAKIKTL